VFNPFIRDGYTGQMPLRICPFCSWRLDGVTNLTSKERPSVGDFTVCINCHSVLRFGLDMDLMKSSLLEVPTHLRAFYAKVIRCMETMPPRPPRRKK
jgi:hypothetical protein